MSIKHGQETFSLNEMCTACSDTPHNHKDSGIAGVVWTCTCGADYLTIGGDFYDGLDIHCPCGEYWKKGIRLPKENVKEYHIFDLLKERKQAL